MPTPSLHPTAPEFAALKTGFTIPAGEMDNQPGLRREQLLTRARSWLSEQKQALKRDFMASGDADALLKKHAAVIDGLITTCYQAALDGSKAKIAVLAVGGYGRCELFPYSDIDLLFLYEAGGEKEAGRIAEYILYLLWDLGLTVGQAHRSVDETIELAREDITIRTNLLDARLIVGEPKLFQNFSTRFEKEIVEETPLAFVEAKLAERDSRHLRFGDSRYMLEPNVKEGKGGLRDLHTLWWLARYVYGVRSLSELVERKLLTEEEFHTFDQAQKFLCRVRIYLHYLADRPEERLTFDRQRALAVSMGFPHPSANRAIERFMRRYFVAVRTVGTFTRIFCALLEDEKKRKPRRSLAWLWQSPWKLHGFVLDGERLNVKNEHAFERDPVLMLEMFRVAQMHDLYIHPGALALMGRNLKRIDDKVQNDPKANAIFLEILLSEKEPEVTLRRMSEAGVLGRFIPDFGRVVGQTQFNMYHVYTVDEHTLVAIGLLNAMEKGGLAKEAPVASEVIKRIQMRRVLYLSLFCHDIAKGRGGDHSELGEKIAMKLARRFGFSEDEVETVAWLVRCHLIFSDTAFKRDIEDPRTVQDFVAAVKSSERLKLLFVLTVADIRAVAPTVWNGWKASLMRELYRRTEQCIGTGQVELKQQQAGQFRDELRKLLPDWQEREVNHYLEQGNASFWASCDLAHHARIARMLRQSADMDMPLLIDTEHDYERTSTEITVCTPDQHGLFSKLAGAMSLAGANIVSAKIFTLKNGMAIDIFQVQDASGAVFDRPDKLAKMSVYIEQVLSGEMDLAKAIAARPEYKHPSREAVRVPGQVFIENEASHIATVIEISGHDRAGFLYRVTTAMADLGLSIIAAHIFTYGTQVADVFYVKDLFGMKITHDTRIKQVREKLLTAINQP